MDAQEINSLFRQAGRTLGSVESFTGGLFAQQMTAISGASHFYKGGMVTYFTEEKVRLLGMTYSELDQFGVVSQETAGTMASHAKNLLNVDYCVSFTGNAGPEAMEDKPVGEIYIGVACYDHVSVYKYNLSGTREEIQKEAVIKACEILALTLAQNH